MKKILLQIIVLAVVVGGVWIGGVWYGSHKESEAPATVKSAPPSVTAAPVYHPPVSQPQPLMAPNQWPVFLSARQAAFKSDPDLVAEHQKIMKEMDAQQAKLDAAVVAVDPKLKPVMEKLAILRKKNSVPNETVPGAAVKAAPITPSVTLTPEDLNELRAARMKVMQTNPVLVANAKKIADQMKAFEGKLDAAMVKADPNVSPLIAQFEGRRAAPAVPATSQSVK